MVSGRQSTSSRPVRSLARLMLGAAALVLLACESDAGADAASGDASRGDALLAFTCKGSVHKASKLVDPLRGVAYGSLFLSEDVGVAGPIAGAPDFASVEVSGLDLVGEGTVAGAFRTPKLNPGFYTFLGFFDVDANGAASKDPDAGDPVTLAITNTFKVEAGKTTDYTGTFDLVLN